MRPLGPYESVVEAGKGSAGAIYQTLDPAANRRVSLWLIDLSRWRTAQIPFTVELLLNELQALRVLSHPNITATYDVLQQEHIVEAVTEFVSGLSFRDILRETHKVAIEDLLPPLRQVAQALDYAHRKGVVHGALRPEHIVLPQVQPPNETAAKIAGFVLAMALGPADASTEEELRHLGYRSPEQIEGQRAGAKSDQFSFAVIIYELIGGQKPFRGASDDVLSQSILRAEPKPVNEINPELTETVGKVLGRALAKSPHDRFASVSDFFGALSIAIGESQHLPQRTLGAASETTDDEDPVPVSATTSDPRLRERSPSAVRRLGLIVLLCFLLAAVLVFIVRMNSGTPIPVQVIETRSAPATPPTADEHTQGSAGSGNTPAQSTPPASTPPASKRAPETQPRARAAEKQPRSMTLDESRREELPSEAGSTADVDITSEPPGARIAVDGRSDAVCHAPCTMTLPVGRHTLAAQLDGYSIAQRIFTAPDPDGIYVQMAQSYGVVVLTSMPTNVAIQVDGKNYGATPATLRLSAGTHRITLLNGSRKHEETFDCAARHHAVAGRSVVKLRLGRAQCGGKIAVRRIAGDADCREDCSADGI